MYFNPKFLSIARGICLPVCMIGKTIYLCNTISSGRLMQAFFIYSCNFIRPHWNLYRRPSLRLLGQSLRFIFLRSYKTNYFTDYEPIDAIQEAMGIMGPWHIIIAVALSLVNFPVAWHQLSIGIIAPTPNFTCISPQSVDNGNFSTQCEIYVGNGTKEKCREFQYDRSIFAETIITQVWLYTLLYHSLLFIKIVVLFSFLFFSGIWFAIAHN